MTQSNLSLVWHYKRPSGLFFKFHMIIHPCLISYQRSERCGVLKLTLGAWRERAEYQESSVAMAFQQVKSIPNGNERNIKLNILMMTMGTRGDTQPILEIGKLLEFRHGHHVRVATHPRHQKQVEEAGLEFQSIGGGDPADFLAFRIQNFKDQLKGRHEMLANMRTMGEGYWKACIGSSDGLSDDSSRQPFVADAIISTPPCFPNISCASRLGIPLHIISANPWSPTKYLPHCLAAWCSGGNYKSMNMLSYLVFNWRFDRIPILRINSIIC